MTPLNFGDGRRKIGLILGGLAVFFICSYALYTALPFLLGPYLTVRAETVAGVTTIQGETKRVSYLAINGAPVSLEETGRFSIERAYPLGYTAVQAQARDRFGRTITKTITFVVSTTTTYGKEEN